MQLPKPLPKAVIGLPVHPRHRLILHHRATVVREVQATHLQEAAIVLHLVQTTANGTVAIPENAVCAMATDLWTAHTVPGQTV